MSEAVVYRMYDADDVLLYVGMSTNLPQRLAGHRSDKEWWPSVIRVELAHFDGRKAAATAEAEAIVNENPAHNRSAGHCVSYDTLRERDEQQAADSAHRAAERKAKNSWHPAPGTVVCTNCDRYPERMPKGKVVEDVICARCGCHLSRGKAQKPKGSQQAQLTIVPPGQQATA